MSINGVKDDGSLEFFNWVFQSWQKFEFLSSHTKNGTNYFQLLARFNDRQPDQFKQTFFGWRRVQVYTSRVVVYYTRTIVLIVASDTMPDLSSVAAMECDEVTILDAAGLEARGAGGAA